MQTDTSVNESSPAALPQQSRAAQPFRQPLQDNCGLLSVTVLLCHMTTAKLLSL